MTDKTWYICAVLVTILASSSVLGDEINHASEEESVKATLSGLDLDESTRAEALAVFERFRQDRRRSMIAMQDLGEELPPEEEVTATRTYPDEALAEQLRDTLSEEEVEAVVSTIQERREMRYRQQANR